MKIRKIKKNLIRKAKMTVNHQKKKIKMAKKMRKKSLKVKTKMKKNLQHLKIKKKMRHKILRKIFLRQGANKMKLKITKIRRKGLLELVEEKIMNKREKKFYLMHMKLLSQLQYSLLLS